MDHSSRAKSYKKLERKGKEFPSDFESKWPRELIITLKLAENIWNLSKKLLVAQKYHQTSRKLVRSSK